MPERIEILSISTIVDQDGYPVFAGTIGRIGIGNEQFRTIVSRYRVNAVNAVKPTNVSSNDAIDLLTVHFKLQSHAKRFDCG